MSNHLGLHYSQINNFIITRVWEKNENYLINMYSHSRYCIKKIYLITLFKHLSKY